MAENLLNSSPAAMDGGRQDPAAPRADGPTAPDCGEPSVETPNSLREAACPDGIPAKFWDVARGELRSDALIKSYLELERKLGGTTTEALPASADEYDITCDDEVITSDPAINKRLHEAGFSREQAQLVYDLAKERLTPLVAELATAFEAERQVERLVDHFGGADRWRETSRQISQWGKSRFPESVYQALSTTYEGVVAMYRMMLSDEPGLIAGEPTIDGAPSEASLRQMMRDPRYWRERDPRFVEQVQEGFRRLYPD